MEIKAIDTSLFFNEGDMLSGTQDNKLAWQESEYIEPYHQKDVTEEEDEYKDSANFEVKKEIDNSDITISKKQEKLSTIVNEYENWEGRIVSTEAAFIRARLINTQRIYSPRMIQIDKNLFAKNGINKDLEIGDMFELTFKYVQEGKYNKRKEFSYQTINVDTIRMIEQVRLSQQEIQAMVEKELSTLSSLFE